MRVFVYRAQRSNEDEVSNEGEVENEETSNESDDDLPGQSHDHGFCSDVRRDCAVSISQERESSELP